MSTERSGRGRLDAHSFDPSCGDHFRLPMMGGWPEAVHRFDEDSKWAVKTALAARRPLLLRGEPGIGKSQIARAVAVACGVPFLPFVVSCRSECTDLLYEYDAVARLSQAQIQVPDEARRQDLLAEERFVRPGALWWAFDWGSARRQARTWCRACGSGGIPEDDAECCEHCCEPRGEHIDKSWAPGQGAVVLIDEIDKADAEFPNGLLESLGNTGFHVPPTRRSVSLSGAHPLVVITSNGERELPAAFVRRCLVLHLPFPKEDPAGFLTGRGAIHFPKLAKQVLAKAADVVLRGREQEGRAYHRPGVAEYLDILRALDELFGKSDEAEERQLAELARISKYSLGKTANEREI